MRRAHAAAGRIGLGVDRIAAVDAAGGVLARENRVGLVADIDGLLDMDRPALAVPPHDPAALQIITRQYLHECASSATCSIVASSRAVTSPMTMRAGLLTRSRSTRSGSAASGPRKTRMF